MNKIELRPYQKKQINFIEDRIDLTDVVGIESPTGSGKTFVILEYAKRWLEKPENQLSNVVISTGFNNLVFLLEKRAKEIGLNPKVLIGTKACNCPKCMEEAGVEPKLFTENSKFICGDKHKILDNSTNIWAKKRCPYTSNFYNKYIDQLVNGVGQIIITNHSSLLVHQNKFENVSLIILDEAHTFSDFYESFIRLELDENDLKIIDRCIDSLKSPMNKIIKSNISKGAGLPSVQLDKLCEKLSQETEDIELLMKTREFFEIKPDIRNYIESKDNSITIDRFYRNFEFEDYIHAKFIIFSATLDKYTRMMFHCRESYFYKERQSFCDFSKSEFIAIPNEDFEVSFLKFLDYVNSKGLERGLCLSTTIADVNKALIYDGYLGYKMFTDSKKFEKYKDGKKILVGSRRFFQGIDIIGLQFVCMNKLPFPTWNEKTQKMRDYVTNFGNNDIDFWTDFSVPKTENDIIQGTGRLWRTPDSFGIISIFDPRIIKHKYMIRHVLNDYRHGIKINIMDDENNVKKFDVSKLEEVDTRKDESSGISN